MQEADKSPEPKKEDPQSPAPVEGAEAPPKPGVTRRAVLGSLASLVLGGRKRGDPPARSAEGPKPQEAGMKEPEGDKPQDGHVPPSEGAHGEEQVPQSLKEYVTQEGLKEEQFVQQMIQAGVGRDDAKQLLQDAYGKTPDEADQILNNDEVNAAFETQEQKQKQAREQEGSDVKPAPAERVTTPVAEGDEHDLQQGLDTLDELQGLSQSGEKKPEAVQNAIKKARGLNWKKIGKYTLNGFSLSILGMILLFIQLLAWHGGGGQR